MHPFAIGANMGRTDGEAGPCELAGDVEEKTGPVAAGYFDDGAVNTRLPLDDDERGNDKGGLTAAGGRGFTGPPDTLASCCGGAQILSQARQRLAVVGAHRLAARILNVEDVQHASLAGVIEVGGDNIGAGGAEGPTQISEQAGTIGG